MYAGRAQLRRIAINQQPPKANRALTQPNNFVGTHDKHQFDKLQDVLVVGTRRIGSCTNDNWHTDKAKWRKHTTYTYKAASPQMITLTRYRSVQACADIPRRSSKTVAHLPRFPKLVFQAAAEWV